MRKAVYMKLLMVTLFLFAVQGAHAAASSAAAVPLVGDGKDVKYVKNSPGAARRKKHARKAAKSEAKRASEAADQTPAPEPVETSNRTSGNPPNDASNARPALVPGSVRVQAPERISSNGAIRASLSGAVKTKISAPQASPWSARLGMDHFFAVAEQDPFLSLAAEVGYAFGPATSVRVVQPAMYSYEVGQDQPEVIAYATSLSLSQIVARSWLGLQWKLGSAVTLPVSTYSRKQEVLTRASLSLSISRKLFRDRLNLVLKPFYRRQFNRYRTTIDGAPMPLDSVGQMAAASLRLNQELSLDASAEATYGWTEKSIYATGPVNGNGTYAFNLSIGYAAMPGLDLAVGASQEDSFVKNGRYEVNVYDEANTRYFVGVSASI